MPKQFAFFLPQFHRIPENDEWWGEGFTEWVNVKKARPLYRGHNQPKVPQHGRYYNLLDKETVQWQTGLLKNYHVDGLIYYHYYFKGRKLLEKPAENLLKWKDIDQPFFFCWANHSWFRTWEGSAKLLVKQEYGSREDWQRHFEYLLPFFQDSRYEKRDNKPLFMVFKSEFPEKHEMFSFFDDACRNHGFDGICIIETWNSDKGQVDVEDFKTGMSEHTEFVFAREPGLAREQFFKSILYKPERIRRKCRRSLKKLLKLQLPEIFSGDELYRQKLKTEKHDPRVIHGTFFEWDNTPRHGGRGYVITPVSKQLFFRYMDQVRDEEYLFINAWNEWAEGMMIEPTEAYGARYLEWISEWVEKNDNR